MAGNEHEVHRSAKTGKFVKESTTERQPESTTTETVGGERAGGDREVDRSTKTGRFVKETTTELHPGTTETQRV
jgi:hypothetical protein